MSNIPKMGHLPTPDEVGTCCYCIDTFPTFRPDQNLLAGDLEHLVSTRDHKPDVPSEKKRIRAAGNGTGGWLVTMLADDDSGMTLKYV